MLNKIYLVLFILIWLLVSSCNQRLDDFLFNGSQVDQYSLDNYSGEVSIDVGNEYFVPSNSIHEFFYEIEHEGEILKLAAIFVGDTNKIKTDTVLLYCHGNRDHMDFYWPRQKLMSHIGGFGRFGVLMFDYPGYGRSEGKTTEANMYASLNGAMHWLQKKGMTDNRLAVMGFSLGGAPTCQAAANKLMMQPYRFILEAPFASAEMMIHDAAQLALPASYFVNLKVDNAEVVKNANVPMLWMHGVNDAFLSIETHGEIVYKNKTGDKEAERVEGADHETVPVFMGYENYNERILTFLTKKF